MCHFHLSNLARLIHTPHTTFPESSLLKDYPSPFIAPLFLIAQHFLFWLEVNQKCKDLHGIYVWTEYQLFFFSWELKIQFFSFYIVSTISFQRRIKTQSYFPLWQEILGNLFITRPWTQEYRANLEKTTIWHKRNPVNFLVGSMSQANTDVPWVKWTFPPGIPIFFSPMKGSPGEPWMWFSTVKSSTTAMPNHSRIKNLERGGWQGLLAPED